MNLAKSWNLVITKFWRFFFEKYTEIDFLDFKWKLRPAFNQLEPPFIDEMVIHPREKGITTLRTYQYWIFHHTVIETCFEMLKSSEREKLWCYSSYKSPYILDCSEVI